MKYAISLVAILIVAAVCSVATAEVYILGPVAQPPQPQFYLNGNGGCVGVPQNGGCYGMVPAQNGGCYGVNNVHQQYYYLPQTQYYHYQPTPAAYQYQYQRGPFGGVRANGVIYY